MVNAGQWLSLELWSLREAAYLLCGREPADEGAFKIEMHSGSDVAQAYRELKDATLTGYLKFVEVDGKFLRRRVAPAAAVAWGKRRAQDRGIPFPGHLLPATKGGEDAAGRQRRRLARLRELGGDMRRAGAVWQCSGRRGALAELVREEAAAGRPRADKSDVRRDLIAAMEAHRGS